MNSVQRQRTISKELVAEFRRIDCADVADAVRGLGLVGVAQGLYPLNREWKICGRAVTVRQVPLQDPKQWSGEDTNLTSLLPMCEPGDIIVADAGGRLDVAIFGSGSAVKAKKFGLEGFVIDGACRDTQGLIDVGCPTFVRGICLVHPSGMMLTTCINSDPVQIGVAPMAVSVAPGDLVMGDGDGIVVVPASRALEVLPLAQQH